MKAYIISLISLIMFSAIMAIGSVWILLSAPFMAHKCRMDLREILKASMPDGGEV